MDEKTRYKMILAYDGTNFSGFQIQPNAKTVQGEIEKALEKMAKGFFVRVHAAGRTDAGVHANGQVIHFDYPKKLPVEAMLKGLNRLTDPSIAFSHSEIVENTFHSRFLAKGKMYRYRIDNNKVQSPFTRFFAYHHRHKLDVKRARKALTYFEGTHDFTSFTSTNTDKENKVRTIYEASVKVNEQTNEWIFTFRGNGFLYNMIRVIMGTVIQVADGRRSVEDIPKILEAKDREAAGPTLSPKGLYMEKVYYNEEEIPGFSKGENVDD